MIVSIYMYHEFCNEDFVFVWSAVSWFYRIFHELCFVIVLNVFARRMRFYLKSWVEVDFPDVSAYHVFAHGITSCTSFRMIKVLKLCSRSKGFPGLSCYPEKQRLWKLWISVTNFEPFLPLSKKCEISCSISQTMLECDLRPKWWRWAEGQ